MKLVNLTPHAITLQDAAGARVTIPPSGTVARVASTPGGMTGHAIIHATGSMRVPIFGAPTWGAVEMLPAPEADTLYVVSALVAARCPNREDVVSPGTGPQDGAIRGANGQIEAVTRLIRA
jgi:hypothetical protein